MQKRTKLLTTFLIAILLIGGLYMFTDWFSKITGYFTGESEKVRVAHCLTDQGAEFYGTEYCATCEKQKDILGSEAFRKINYIDCGKDKEDCPNIQSIPAWFIPNSEKKINYGFFELKELKKISGCK